MCSQKFHFPMSILFVCSGNICRSPAAEGIARVVIPAVIGNGKVKFDSAGIGSWHAGQVPEQNMRKVAKERGFPIDDLRARQIAAEDFEKFDLIIGMDSENMSALKFLKERHGGKAKIRKLLEEDVPDPYYGGLQGFYNCFDMIKGGVEKLSSELTETQK